MIHGIAFGDHIKTEKSKKYRYGEDEKSPMRLSWLFVLLILFCGFVLLRLFSLQVVNATYYKRLSDGNRTRTVVIHAPRGVILDRNNTPLVFNVPGFRKTDGKKITFLQREDALSRIAKGEKGIEIDTLRNYPYKDILSHVVGYIGQIDPDTVKDPEFAKYLASDTIGKAGLEQEYEHQLKGQDGHQLVEVDAMGKVIRTLGQTDPVSGQDIQTTLDIDLQKAVYSAMNNVIKGAVVVSKPDGEILAMVSKPTYDPNLFTMGETYRASSPSAYPTIASVLLDGQNQPLLDRNIAGAYPPGSTFKIVAAVAGLEKKIIDETYSIVDTGVVHLGTFSFSNWYLTEYGKTEIGPVNVTRAIARSNDIFFYKLSELLHVDGISDTANKFGVGQKLGIDLKGEVAGLLPTTEWKQKNIGEQWYTGDTYQYGIGQGYLLTTPLQVNAWTQAIANRGILYQPHLLTSTKPKVLSKNLLSQKTFDLVQKGMVDACETGGTAWPIFDFTVKNPSLPIDGVNYTEASATSSAHIAASESAQFRHVRVACKTGTAQQGDEKALPHAWITLFAPAENPEIVVTVLKESAGEGSNEAGPIAKQILTSYFENKR
jgi:penicillin-binding protein 2